MRQGVAQGVVSGSGGEEYEWSTLSNGLRVATARLGHVRSVCVALWAGVGGRHERSAECGVAHLLEHMLFKGTARRSAKEISRAVEGVGGYLNAFTTEDHTCFYAKAAASRMERVMDVLADMYVGPRLDARDIEREREVIREEIASCRDNPGQYVDELLNAGLWGRHPLGKPITGTSESIDGLDAAILRRFHGEGYSGANTVLSVAGPVEHGSVVEMAEGFLGGLPRGRVASFKRFAGRASGCVESFEQMDVEQSHLSMGFLTGGRRDPRRFALRILSVVAGENMSSRLFQSMRERLGLCYSVNSGVEFVEESGAFTLQADLEPAKVARALEVMRREFRRFAEKPLSVRELRDAKEYAIGQAIIAAESTTHHAMALGEGLLGVGRCVVTDELVEKIGAVTAEEVRGAASDLFGESGSALAVVGPEKSW